MPHLKYFLLALLGLAGLIALGASAQTGNHGRTQPQHITVDPNGGTPGPP